ncbi:MAG: radical SAM family heme chaperone HemW [Pseudohongiellaceae bacterium]
MLELPPLSLYIHIPWCVKKCPYCDFNSHEAQTEIPEQDYVEVLCQDFDRDYEFCDERAIHSIFIGGGTPSLFAAKSFDKILQYIQSRARLSSDCEITLEANPGTAEAAKFAGYFSAGVNRLSLGVQSFNDSQLRNLGRIHSSGESRRAIELARNAGFENFNLDLMHGLPGQTIEAAMQDLQSALGFDPPHISWYQLTIEPNTVFHARPPALPDEPVLNALEEAGLLLLAENNYERYEVSAFTKGNRPSRHNLNYWEFGDYIGIGAGAHGKITVPVSDSIVRTQKHRQPIHYLSNSIQSNLKRTEIALDERPIEFLLNALRSRRGFTESMFQDRTGLPFSVIGKKVEYLLDNGLLQQKEGRIAASDRGYRLLNSLLQEFL